jgi:hypothetical protein
MGYKCKPITEKAKSSPFKINDALVYGAADVSKKFVDAAGSVGKGINEAAGPSGKGMKKTAGADIETEETKE